MSFTECVELFALTPFKDGYSRSGEETEESHMRIFMISASISTAATAVVFLLASALMSALLLKADTLSATINVS